MMDKEIQEAVDCLKDSGCQCRNCEENYAKIIAHIDFLEKEAIARDSTLGGYVEELAHKDQLVKKIVSDYACMVGCHSCLAKYLCTAPGISGSKCNTALIDHFDKEVE